jgi:cytochrome b6-f complex iron-sulfur subunit
MEPTRPPAEGGGLSSSKQTPKEPPVNEPPGKAAAQAAKPAPKQSLSETAKAQASPTGAVDPLKARRRVVWTVVAGFLTTNLLMFFRFFFPRTLFEPSTKFRIGAPSDFGLGVDERFKQSHRVWVVRRPDRLFVIFGRCTHLGCTPNWVESENKFKCPCHGSGYDIEGINFEGPAPRPMDRAQVELDAEGQIVVDTSRLYKCPPGEKCEFDTDANSYLIISS